LRSPTLTTVFVGTAYCLAAAILYTGANACLRILADQAYQPWVICVKEAVTVLAVGPWLLYQARRGRRIWPASSALLRLALVGLAVQFCGNLCLLWSLEVIGLSITIPVVIAVNLTMSAVLGRALLGEAVSVRSQLAIGALIVAVVLLKFGASGVESSAGRIAWAVAAAGLAGVTFAALAVTIRKSVTEAVPPTTVVFLITAMGVASLGPLSLGKLGWDGLWTTPPRLLGLMLLAGLLNFAAFLSITKGFQYATVVRANVLSTSQAALAAIVGLLFFAEPPGMAVLAGILLTISGTLLVEPGQHTGGCPKPGNPLR
jgi:drug/metabolite transporter, DME family